MERGSSPTSPPMGQQPFTTMRWRDSALRPRTWPPDWRDGTFGMAEETGRGMNEAITAGHTHGYAWAKHSAARSSRSPPSPTPSCPCCWPAGGSASRSRCTPPSAPRSFTSIRPPTARDRRHQPPRFPPAVSSAGWSGWRRSRRQHRQCGHHAGGVFSRRSRSRRNLHDGRPTGFLTCDLDMQRHYRPAGQCRRTTDPERGRRL